MVKEFLAQRGINITERDVSRDSNAAQELVSRTGQMGVPVTLINGQTVIGYNQAQLEQAIGEGERPSFGASVADASKITARQGGGITPGAYVGRIRPGSAAERAGLAPGDIVLEINMQRITNAIDLENAISRLSKGSRISVLFLRGNQQLTGEGTL